MDDLAGRPGPFRGHRVLGGSIVADFGGPRLAVSAADGIVRLRFAADGVFTPRRSWAPADDSRLETPIVESAYPLRLTCGSLSVRIDDGCCVLVRSGDRALFGPHDDEGPSWTPNGLAKRWRFAMPPGHSYGLGERTGLLDKRGKRYTNWTTDRYEGHGPTTDELYVAVPLVIDVESDGSARGLFLNSTYRSCFDLSDVASNAASVWVEDGDIDLFVIDGPDVGAVVRCYSELTGRPQLPPRWALGYHQARWSYASEDEVRHIADEFRDRRLPCDSLHFDIDCMDGFRSFTWDAGAFPKPGRLIADLGARGFHAAAVVDPSVKYEPEGGYALYDEGAAAGHFVRRGPESDEEFLGYVWPGLCALPDFARADVRDWWAKWHATLFEDGVRCVIADMNEPALRDRPIDDPNSERIDPPPSAPHGGADEPATHAEVHNVYGVLHAQATAEAFAVLLPEERSFVMTRAGFAGVQRSAGVWTGDNASTWEHLEMSLPQILNLGLSGVAFAGADIGGFFENCGPELLVRWMQLGAAYPYMRNHCAEGCAPQEPWVWGPDVEDACRASLELRYRLLPYLYTVLEESTRTGDPVLRPLVYHYGDDPRTRALHDQALIGRDLMVAPVVRPGVQRRNVYLPLGLWYETASDHVYVGPADVSLAAPLHTTVPLLARGGSIVPTGPVVQWSDEQPLDPLTLDIYPDDRGTAHGRLYEDDGTSREYVGGRRCWTDLLFDGTSLHGRRSATFEPDARDVVVRLHDRDAVLEAVVRDEPQLEVAFR
jgi:alpha-glucosidase